MPRRVFFLKGALRYRYKRDLRKGPRVTPSFALLKRVGRLMYYIICITKNQIGFFNKNLLQGTCSLLNNAINPVQQWLFCQGKEWPTAKLKSVSLAVY